MDGNGLLQRPDGGDQVERAALPATAGNQGAGRAVHPTALLVVIVVVVLVERDVAEVA